jgi:glutathionyl-hydroquinone reductase
MRDRYYVRFERLLGPYSKVLDEWRAHQVSLPTNQRDYSSNSMIRWFEEKYNIVYSANANGVIKLGFASEQDVTVFALRLA